MENQFPSKCPLAKAAAAAAATPTTVMSGEVCVYGYGYENDMDTYASVSKWDVYVCTYSERASDSRQMRHNIRMSLSYVTSRFRGML